MPTGPVFHTNLYSRHLCRKFYYGHWLFWLHLYIAHLKNSWLCDILSGMFPCLVSCVLLLSLCLCVLFFRQRLFSDGAWWVCLETLLFWQGCSSTASFTGGMFGVLMSVYLKRHREGKNLFTVVIDYVCYFTVMTLLGGWQERHSTLKNPVPLVCKEQ